MRYEQILNRDVEEQKTTAELRGGAKNPDLAPSVSLSANLSSTITEGIHYVAHTWVTEHGETQASPAVSIMVEKENNLVVTLPAFPEYVLEANIYIGKTLENVTKQGSTAFSTFTLNQDPVQGLRQPTENTSYRWITPTLLTDESGTEKFTEANPGKIDFTRGAIKGYFSGNADTTETFNEEMTGFSIYNEGISSLQFTIGGITIPVGSNEGFEGQFDPFTEVTITATSTFKAYVTK